MALSKTGPQHVKRIVMVVITVCLLLAAAIGFLGAWAQRSALDFSRRPGPGFMVLVEAGWFVMGVDPDPGSPEEGRQLLSPWLRILTGVEAGPLLAALTPPPAAVVAYREWLLRRLNWRPD